MLWLKVIVCWCDIFIGSKHILTGSQILPVLPETFPSDYLRDCFMGIKITGTELPNPRFYEGHRRI